MKTILKSIFVENWQRKCISVLLAILIWFLVNQSLISSKTVGNIPVRLINIPAGKTVIDLQNNGLLAKRVTLTLVGNKTLLDELTANDLEIVIDAQGKQGEWIATITKKNLISLNPEFDVNKGISRISQASVIIRLTKLVTEKIPIFITQPIGESPRGYQYLDIWPYQLNLTISGPEEVVKRLKAKGIRLTFDLNDISKKDLDNLRAARDSKGDEVSFLVPDNWKRVQIPSVSDTPIEIDDPKAKDLRIEFVRISLLPISKPLSIALFFPFENLDKLNPANVSIATSDLIQKNDGVDLFKKPLYAKGVSPLFLQVVQEMIQMSITVEPESERRFLDWSIQFINPRFLEDRYVSLMMSEASDEDVKELQPNLREEYLRNRFRNYMNSFQLFKADDKKLDLSITLENQKVMIKEANGSASNTSYLKTNSHP